MSIKYGGKCLRFWMNMQSSYPYIVGGDGVDHISRQDIELLCGICKHFLESCQHNWLTENRNRRGNDTTIVPLRDGENPDSYKRVNKAIKDLYILKYTTVKTSH